MIESKLRYVSFPFFDYQNYKTVFIKRYENKYYPIILNNY